MARGRPKIEVLKIAGERLRIALEVFGETYESLVGDTRWKKIVGIFNPRTIGRYVQEGVPLNRIGKIAVYFGVYPSIFNDATLNIQTVRALLSEALQSLKYPKDTSLKNHTPQIQDKNGTAIERNRKFQGLSQEALANRLGNEDVPHMNAATSKEILTLANTPGGRDKSINSLLVAMRRPDPQERYWAYITLGQIGGHRARTALMEGLRDPHEVARLGAKNGWKTLEA